MTYLKIFAILVFCLTLNSVKAQNVKYKTINVGEQCPDVTLKMLNYPSQTAKLSELKGRLLIIDFWATWCGPCRGFLRTVDTLQKQFQGKIQIIPVTYEDKNTVEAYLNGLKTVTGLNVSTAIQDSVLQQLFPHTYIPHEVWIDLQANGKVIAITDEEQVTAGNIKKVLFGLPVNLKMEQDEEQKKIDYHQPVLTGDQGIIIPDSNILLNIDNPKYHVILTKRIPGLTLGRASTSHLLFTTTNSQLFRILQEVTSSMSGEFIQNQRTMLLLSKRDRNKIADPYEDFATGRCLNRDSAIKWCNDNAYCFEINIKDTSLSKDRFKIAHQILNDYFKKWNIITDLENRDHEYYALKRTSNIDKLRSKGGERNVHIDQYGVHATQYSLAEFFFKMNYFLQGQPLPLMNDEIGFTEPIDLDLTCNLEDINAVNKALAAYDLQFVKETSKIPMVVIKNIK